MPIKYSTFALPPHAYVPGRQSHPAPDHLAIHDFTPRPLSRCEWQGNQHYLHGIDLFNHHYYWECHEALEKIWLLETNEDLKRFLQGIILGSAALLKLGMGQMASASRLQQSVGRKMIGLPAHYCGLHPQQFADSLKLLVATPDSPSAEIQLHLTHGSASA